MHPDDESNPSAAPGRSSPSESGASPWSAFEARLAHVAGGVPPAADPEDDESFGRVPATVLLSGESGSGKSRAARRFHDLSGRREGPFVSVHLAGLAATLLEAELFGHAEGAFTGASGERQGRFARASGGTIVLESVETLELDLQVKLLRVLQERVVEPVGSEGFEEVDVQVIATAAPGLRGAVEAGRFREDLYYRLAVVPLEVPPLRTRTSEAGFGDLCAGIVKDVAKRVGGAQRPITDEAMVVLREHPWPGNLRELENAFERVLVLGGVEEAIGAGELRFLSESVAGRANEIAREVLRAGVPLEELEAAVLEAALEQEKGNLSAAARCVGLSRRAFSYRRKKLDGS